MRARVLVRPKAGILDPQGQAVERALPALGFTGVTNVHAGKSFRLTMEAPNESEALEKATSLAERLLSNPVIEDSVARLG